MSLTGCITKAGAALGKVDKLRILEAAAKHRAAGLSADKAGRKAVDEVAAAVQSLIDGYKAAPKPAPATGPFADNYAALNGKTITQQVMVADTGKTATLRMDAGQALRSVGEREQALVKLKACIGR